MLIISVAYASADNASLLVTTADMGDFVLPFYPSNDPRRTWHNDALDKWLADNGGNDVISEYVPPKVDEVALRAEKYRELAILNLARSEAELAEDPEAVAHFDVQVTAKAAQLIPVKVSVEKVA